MDSASGSAVVLRTPQKVATKDLNTNPSFIPRRSTGENKKRLENRQGKIPNNLASNENTPHHSNVSMVTPLPSNRSMMTPQHSKKSTVTKEEFWKGSTPCSLDKPLPQKVHMGRSTPAPNLMSTINEVSHGIPTHKSTKLQGHSFIGKPKTVTPSFSKEPVRRKHPQSARRFTSPKEGPSRRQTPATTRPGQKYSDHVSSIPRPLSQPAPPSTPIQQVTPESGTNRREELAEWKLRQTRLQLRNVDVLQNSLREKHGGSAQKLRDKRAIKSLKSNTRIAPSLKLQLEKLELADEKREGEVRACMENMLNSINLSSGSNASQHSPNVGEELFTKAELTRKRQKEREEALLRQSAQEDAMLKARLAQEPADQLANDEKVQKAQEEMLAALGANSSTSKVPAKTPARKLYGKNLAEATPRRTIRSLSKLAPSAPPIQAHQPMPSDLEATKSNSKVANDSSALPRDPQPTSKSKANGAKGLKTPTTSGRLRRLSKGVTTPPPFSLHKIEPCPPGSKSAQGPRRERRMSHPRYVNFDETLKNLDVNAAAPVTPLPTPPQRSWWRSSWWWTARILGTLSFWIILNACFSKQKPGSCRNAMSSSIFLSECVPDQDTNFIEAGEVLNGETSTIKGDRTKVETTPDLTSSKDEASTNQENTVYNEGPVMGEGAVEWERTAPVEVEQIKTESLTQQEAAEKVKLEQEHLERERLAFEKAEFERAEQEQEHLEQERLEQERLAFEKAEFERAERLEQERLEQERLEQERLEQERLEQERLAFEKAEFERAEQEQERLEQERLEQERLAFEKAEFERAERLEQERLEQERLAFEKAEFERAEQEQERLKQERLEQERLAFEKAEFERAEQEQERLEQERLEQERLAFENAEFERAERLEQERVANQKTEAERVGRGQGTIKHTNMPKRTRSKEQESVSAAGNDDATDTAGRVTDYGSGANTLRWLTWFAFVRAKIHLVAASVITGYFLMRPTRTPATGAAQTEVLSRMLSEKASKLQLSITTTFCDLAERVLGISEDVKESSGEEYLEECDVESSSELDQDVLSDADDLEPATDYDEMDEGDFSGSQSESGELIDEEDVQQETRSPVLAPRTISNSMRSTAQTIPAPVVNEEAFTSRSPTGDAGLYNVVEYVNVRGTPFVEKRSVRRSLRNR